MPRMRLITIAALAVSAIAASSPSQANLEQKDVLGHYSHRLLGEIPTAQSITYQLDANNQPYILVTTASGPTATDLESAPTDIEGLPVVLK